MARSISFEILDEGRSAGPNITKVDGFTTRSQQEQSIKDLEKLSGGLHQLMSARAGLKE